MLQLTEKGFMYQNMLTDLSAKTCKHAYSSMQAWCECEHRLFIHPATSLQNVNKYKPATILLIWFTTPINALSTSCISTQVTTKIVH